MRIHGNTRIAAVLGHPIAHTASPAMHNAAFAQLGIDWAYIALDVNPSDLGSALRGLATAGLVGVNLTAPHKLLALRHLDSTDLTARQFGAANTLQFLRRGKQIFIRGYNTDGYGLLRSLKEDLSFHPKNKTVAIVGCGGAGQSAAIQLALSGARRLILLNRTSSKAEAIVRRLRALHLRTPCVFLPESCDLVIQATSLGLKRSDPSPLSVDLLRKLSAPLFLDMIYRPSKTTALRLAQKNGCRAVNGLGMLLHQGARSLEIWTGLKAPVAVMRRALLKEIHVK